MAEAHEIVHGVHIVAGKLYTRYTCYSEGCNGATCLHQPWMSDEMWAEKLAVWTEVHPHTKVMSWPEWQQWKADQNSRVRT